MSKLQAQELVENTLHNDFDKEKFVYFAKNLLNKIDETKIFKYTGAYIAEAFRPFVKSYERIGQYIDPENNKIDILIVYLQKEASLERARTAQRNFVARYLKDRGEKDAGLVAFVSPDPADWRFSLVKMEYKFTEGKSSKVKVKEEFTPAKRWSFLVGKHEDSHTAQSRLAPIIEDDQNNPTLKQLEDAFNIEKVTKEFFEKYRELFLRTHETLNDVIGQHPDIKADFAEKNVNVADFSKKLLGQIVFLYFLQKKGWFGVPMDKGWGDGDKKFLRTRFEEASGKNQNYFNDYLEPLFYEALAKERDGDFYSRFECKIPFLNGGLFDPINNYDWVNTTIDLPNELFSNRVKNPKTGDIGNGVLDIFDRYNFTVKEDEPLEKEVAVDPEMLGKVFENLLEVKDRKSKGTYYTPREIVNYMCEQSLLNYLATELEGKVTKEDLEKLIKFGENVAEHEAVSVSKEDKSEESKRYKRLLADSIKEFAKEIDEKLATIKVCDPAIGSGAFPVGMMNAIVKTRDAINKSYLHDNNQTLYAFKRDCIQNSLYGVDIDPGAVEIAKLRLWLSLVVDEDDIKQIKPLPNLDYKIMQGNSLIEDLVIGDTVIKFNLDELVKVDHRTKEMKNLFEEEKQVKLFKDKSEDIFDALKKLHSVYFEENNRNKKLILKQKIDEKEQSFISAKCDEEIQRLNTVKKNTQDEKKITIAEQQIEAIQTTLQKLERESSRPFFLWKLHFSEVFQENGGFDVVIGNPPYLRVQSIDKEISEQFKRIFVSATGSYDLYVLFAEKAISLIRESGIVNFIMPHKWINSSFGVGLRDFSKNKIHKLISFKEYQVFNASTYTSLVWFKRSNSEFAYIDLHNDLQTNSELAEFLSSVSEQNCTITKNDTLTKDVWIFGDNDVMSVLKKIGTCPLVIKDIFEKVFQGIATGKDSVFFLSECVDMKDGTISCYSVELNKRIEIEKELTKPLLKGDAVHRYEMLGTDKVVILPYYKIRDNNNKEKAMLYTEAELGLKFPKGYSYLKDCEKTLRAREDGRFDINGVWFQFSRKQGILDADKEKLIMPYLSIGSQLSYDEEGKFYCNTKCFGLIKHRRIQESYKYFLALLNSELAWFFIRKTSVVFGGGYYTYTKETIQPFPIPEIRNTSIVMELEILVDQIIQTKKAEPKADTKDLEHLIDVLVYKLYGLTEEEIKLIEQ